MASCASLVRHVGLECCGIFLAVVLCILWVLGWSGLLPFVPAVGKNVQAYSALASTAFTILNSVIVFWLGIRSRRKLARIRTNGEERQNLIVNDIQQNYGALSKIEENTVGIFQQGENLKEMIKELMISGNREVLKAIQAPNSPIQIGSSSSKSEIFIKIVLIGEITVGKTCLTRRWLHGKFRVDYKPTIGVDFGLKIVNTTAGLIKTQSWDIAGQERYGTTTKVYYNETDAAVIVFDVTRRQSYEGAQKWLKDFLMKTSVKHPFIAFIGNKIDLPNHQISEDETDDLPHPVFFTSAKTGENVDHALSLIAMAAAVRQLLNKTVSQL